MKNITINFTKQDVLKAVESAHNNIQNAMYFADEKTQELLNDLSFVLSLCEQCINNNIGFNNDH